MAVLFNCYLAPDARRLTIKRLRLPPAIEIAVLAARVRGAVAEIVVFLWATLTLAFFGLIAAGFLSA